MAYITVGLDAEGPCRSEGFLNSLVDRIGQDLWGEDQREPDQTSVVIYSALDTQKMKHSRLLCLKMFRAIDPDYRHISPFVYAESKSAVNARDKSVDACTLWAEKSTCIPKDRLARRQVLFTRPDLVQVENINVDAAILQLSQPNVTCLQPSRSQIHVQQVMDPRDMQRAAFADADLRMCFFQSANYASALDIPDRCRGFVNVEGQGSLIRKFHEYLADDSNDWTHNLIGWDLN